MHDAPLTARPAPSAADPASAIAGTRQQASAMRARDARGRRTMALMHEALLALIKERAFGRISVDDIIQRAGVSRTTFYRHYAGKDALLEEIASAEITRFAELAVPLADTNDSLPTCRRLVAYVDERRQLWSVLLTGGAEAVMRQRFIELATPEPGSARACPRHGIPVELTARSGVAATVEVLIWWLRAPGRGTREEVARYLDRLAIRPALDPAPAHHSQP